MHSTKAKQNQNGYTCEGCSFFVTVCLLQAGYNAQTSLQLENLNCEEDGLIYMSELKHELTDQDVAYLVFQAIRKDPINPVFPEQIRKRLSELLTETNTEYTLLERLKTSRIGPDLARLQRHIGGKG